MGEVGVMSRVLVALPTYNNSATLRNVLEGCRHARIERLIYASSSSVYGGNSKLPFAVGDPVETPMSLYAATKPFVLSLTEGLAEEIRGTGVTVTALCPGPTDTEMVHDIAPPGGAFPQVPSFMISDVKSVAREGYDACIGGEVVRVPGLANQLSALWSQTQPRWLVRTLGGFIGRQLLRP